MIHPQLRMLEILRLHAGQWLSVGVYIDDEKVCAEPFEALELDLANLWLGLPLRASELTERAARDVVSGAAHRVHGHARGTT